MMHIFHKIIQCIPPAQIENERDFSVAGSFGRAKRASMTVDMLSTLVFINRNLNWSEECASYSTMVELFNKNDSAYFDKVAEKVDEVVENNEQDVE